MICIVCGGGTYPFLIAHECVRKKIDFCLLFLRGFYRANLAWPKVKNSEIGLTEIEKSLKFFRENNVDAVVLAGDVRRPKFSEISLDATGMKWLAHLGFSIFSGDDALLKAVSNLLYQEGLKVISGTDLLDDVFLENGIATKIFPSKDDLVDIKLGFLEAKELGKKDLGQAVVVHNGELLLCEGEKGTEWLINSAKKYRKTSTGGILVKVSKPQQDLRLDLPTIGVDTIYQLSENKFSGIAVEAKKCIVLDKMEVIRQANLNGLFVVGCDLNFLEAQL